MPDSRTRRSIEHLHRIGVTAIELMPVHQFVHDSTLLDTGLRNYWGYNTIGFFAPHSEYSSSGDRASRCRSSRGMVRSMHEAGIEVILDVVYNHTAEGNHLGPTLSFRGIDNAGLLPARRRRPAVLHGLHRHRQLAQRPSPACAAAAHGLAALLGARRCTSTASASTSRPRSPASSTRWTACRRSSSSCSRTPSSRR